MMKIFKSLFLLFVILLFIPFELLGEVRNHSPRIINIVNFIRETDYRLENSDEVLFETVQTQIELANKYHLAATFLFQYDALINPRYQELMKKKLNSECEIGAWWEITQPQVEAAGLKWRGDYSWVSATNIDFSCGYTQKERKKLVDVYMSKFKEIYGRYPKSVGSWFIDAYTLNYMYQKYGIVASCNCKDQIGTDGYTLWGGYWNQAYYPSKENAYMPAQHINKQIPVPVFRMLGSDPVRQYDNGIGGNGQGVVTLEPVYSSGGGDSTWVHWYFKQFVEGEPLAFAYVQVGQENSFTWKAMEKGLEIQFPLIEKLREEGKVNVETLSQSGEWFRKRFSVTPATSVTVNKDLPGSDKKTVWFDSRFYRANLLWAGDTLCFRDIHLFDENIPSLYYTNPATSKQAVFLTLPIVEGNLWSHVGKLAGLYFKAFINGREATVTGGNPLVEENKNGELNISWPLKNMAGILDIQFQEKKIKISVRGNKELKWFLDLEAAKDIELPFTEIKGTTVHAVFKGEKYSIQVRDGIFREMENRMFRIYPEKQKFSIAFGK